MGLYRFLACDVTVIHIEGSALFEVKLLKFNKRMLHLCAVNSNMYC